MFHKGQVVICVEEDDQVYPGEVYEVLSPSTSPYSFQIYHHGIGCSWYTSTKSFKPFSVKEMGKHVKNR